MDNDVELMRDLLLMLEEYQTSPRTVIIISAEDEADALERAVSEIESGLAALLEYEYIEGPGQDEPGFFLFRKLTRKGMNFAEATRRPRDWEKMKRHFEQRRLESETDGH